MASSISIHTLPAYQDTIFSSNPSRLPIVNLHGSRNFRASSLFPLISRNSIKRLSKSNEHPRPPRSFTLRCMNNSKASAITKDSWSESVLESEVPVLVEFYASWCGPCRMVHRVIDEIATEYAGRVKCFVLNTDHDLEIAEDYEIKAVPVVLLFRNGKQQDSVVGTMPKEFYVAAIEKLFAR